MIHAIKHGRVVWLVSGLAFSTPVWSQNEVTIADLQGSVIEARVVRGLVVRKNGREFPVRYQNDFRVVIGPGEQIHYTANAKNYTPSGIRPEKTRAGWSALERAVPINRDGGGHAVWIFRDSTLMTLRTFKEGGFKRTITFARGSNGLRCTASETYARERGTGPVTMTAETDGVLVTIVSSKPISSTCRVTKKEQ
jgi:hypothetical protein